MTTLTPDTSPAEIDALAAQVASGLTTLSQSDVRDGLLGHQLGLRRGASGPAVETRLMSGAGNPRIAAMVDPIEWVRIETDTSTGATTITDGVGTATGPATLVAAEYPLGRSRISK